MAQDTVLLSEHFRQMHLADALVTPTGTAAQKRLGDLLAPGLGGLPVGAGPGTVAAGDDARIAGAVQAAGGNASAAVATAAGATAVRTLAARAADTVNARDFGAVLDGVADDTAALAAAQAAAGSRPVNVPYGTMRVTASLSGITGLLTGPGQLQTSEGTKRAPRFTHLTAAPASLGADFDHAFSGDISKVQIAIEHRISGAATLGQPASAYSMHGEHSPVFLQFLNESGYAANPADQTGGRTGAAAVTVSCGSTGQGDTYALNLSGFVTGTQAGSTNFLANPSFVAIAGGCFSFAHGTYQQFDEFSHDDAGFGGKGYDVAVSSTVRNFNRSNADGAKGAWWLGTRYQTGAGSLPVDAAFQLVGRFNTALETSALTLGPAKAVWTQAAGSRTYLNSTPSADSFANNPAKVLPGAEYTHYNPATSAFEVVLGGVVALAVAATPAKTRANLNKGVVALAGGASIATDASLGNAFALTLGTNATLANPANLAPGASYVWTIRQDAAGGRTLAFGSAFKWPGGTAPALSTAAGAIDVLSAVSDGAVLYGVLSRGFA